MEKQVSRRQTNQPAHYASLLAVDTATRACSVAVSKNNELAVETTTLTSQTHSRHLLKMIQSALNLANVQLCDIDAFVVTKGPGSFTGLRIGISTIKGLAKALGKQFVGISYLECLARQSNVTDGSICAMIDARRNEIYYALYHLEDTELRIVVPESVGSIFQMMQMVDGNCHFIGNGVYPHRRQLRKKFGARATFAPDHLNILKGFMVLDSGRTLLKRGFKEHLEHFTPCYIRKSDAQINLEKQTTANEALTSK